MSPTFTLLTALVLTPLAALNAAEKAPPPLSWTDDFSDAGTLTDNWRADGFFASGIDATHPLGKTVSGKEARPEWWQIVEGALRGQCFPEEKPPPGLRRAISGYEWLGVGREELTILAELLLRGEQTEGSLRGRASRMDDIPDLPALRRHLDALAARGLVVWLTPPGRGRMLTHGLLPPEKLEKVRATVTTP